VKRFLLQFLICPCCLPDEVSLRGKLYIMKRDDILEGALYCEKCRKTFSISQGVANLLPESAPVSTPSAKKYEADETLGAYLWSHYSDLFHDPDATDAYTRWAALLKEADGGFLDIGCAVGRFTFEMASRHSFAVGVDTSHKFIHAARRLMTARRIQANLKQEGHLCTEQPVELPSSYVTTGADFIVGDALALPFRSAVFSSAASLNILDKAPKPFLHLRELNRVTAPKSAQTLISDPFSWSEEAAPEEEWLGGKSEGPRAGAGVDNVALILEQELSPPWNAAEQGSVWWKIRNHANHFELIRSHYVRAIR